MKIATRVQSEWELTDEIIAGSIEVHRHLGPGLLERVYEECLCHELVSRGLEVTRQRQFPLEFKGHTVPGGFVVDLIVNDRVIVELKAVERLLPVFEAQLLSYLRLTRIEVGLLINFQTPTLRQGIRAA